MQQDTARHGLVGLLKTCANKKDLHRGSIVHAHLVRMGQLEKDAFAGSALVSMYAKCGSVERAQEVFDKISTRNIVLWNSLIAGYAQNDRGLEALKCFQQMQLEGMSPDAVTLVCVLRACGSIGFTNKGDEIHAAIVTREGLLEQDVFVGTGLVDLYCKCGLLMKAQAVLHLLPVRNVVSWNALIAGYAQHGHCEEALISFDCMHLDGIIPDAVTFVCTLKACAKTRAACKGQELHAEIVREGWLKKNVIVGIALVDLYAKCSLLAQAQDVFDGLSVRNVSLWNSLIAGYIQSGNGEDALKRFKEMQLEGFSPNAITFVCILKVCGSLGAVVKGQEIHANVVKEGLGQHAGIGTALVEMYAKCGLLAKARELVDNFPIQDTVSWSVLIAGYTQHGFYEKALDCFEQMKLKGMSPDATTYIYILKACGKLRSSVKGRDIHSEILKTEGLLGKNIYVGGALVDMYANCGLLGRAQDVFDELPFCNVVLWSALIAGYVQHGYGEKALECFEQMQRDGMSPNAVTFVCILKACSSIGAVDKGQELHAEVTRVGLVEKDIVVGNALVDMYAKFGLLVKAEEVFDMLPIRNVVTWSALITGYAQHGQGKEALCFFEHMQLEGFSPNEVTFISILKACGSTEDAVKGREIHIEIAREGLLEKHVTLGTALLDMYIKCGLLTSAQEVFDSFPVRDEVAWNVLIWGYTQHGHSEKALSFFERMQLEGTRSDTATFICILKACVSIGAVDKGKEIHAEIVREGLLDTDAGVCTALIDMYAKCGLVAKAHELFDQFGAQDVASWSALIMGYAQYGHFEEALNCFERMQLEGIVPDALTFTCVLKACGSIGAAQKGEEIHAEVLQEGMLEKDVFVGTALLSMYARCGFLAKAQEVFDQLPMQNEVSWSALVAGYAQHGCSDEAFHSFEQMQLEGITPNAITFVCILKACGSIGAADKGLDIHAEIAKEGLLEKHIIVGNALVDMYVTCGLLAKAQEVFDSLPQRNAVSWSTLIAGYAHLGKVENVFDLFDKMIGACVEPDFHTLTSVLHACSHTGLLDKGQIYFEKMTMYGLVPTLEHYNCLADLFGRAGHIDKAIAVIQKMPYPANITAWHNVLGACRKWGNIWFGRVAFEHAVQLDEKDAAAYICMSSMYLGAGRLEEAEMVEAMRVGNNAWQKPELCWFDTSSCSAFSEYASMAECF